jgi:hypothetical protein
MRTTLDIEDDVLAAAKELARLQGTSALTSPGRRACQPISDSAPLALSDLLNLPKAL